MPVCPSCHLGIPWTYTTCPDCGGDLWVSSDEGDEDDHLQIAAAIDTPDEREPEVSVDIVVPDEPPEPEPEPVVVAAPPPRTRKRKRKPRAKPVELVVVQDREPEPDIDVEVSFGPRLGELEEVAGIGEQAVHVIVCESAFVPESGEPIEMSSIGSAVLRKTRLDLYRELTFELSGGATLTIRWLPEYNDDPSTVPVLRAALGDRLRSFEAS